MSLTRPLCILIKGTHFLRGNPEGTHAELKGNPVTRSKNNIHNYCGIPADEHFNQVQDGTAVIQREEMRLIFLL